MDTPFNFKSQVCTDKVQSERLLALGLKKETADCVWIEMSKDDWRIDANGWKAYHSIIEEGIAPAWSLHRLWELSDMQRIVLDNRKEIALIYEGVIEKIEYLIKEGYFNKEYLV